jgi:hypothetical protein
VANDMSRIYFSTQGFREYGGKMDKIIAGLPNTLALSLKDSFRLVGNIASTVFMIQNFQPIPLAGSKPIVDPQRLTWRTRALALSLQLQGRSDLAMNSLGGIRILAQNATTVNGELFTRVPYASIHEYGGTLPAVTIYPVRAKALHWINNAGEDVFAKSAHIGERYVRPRPFLGPATRDPETMAGVYNIFLSRIDGLLRSGMAA